MANLEQLKRLKQGGSIGSAWEEWRRTHPEIKPNLMKADLSGLDLRCADLRGANLRRADLSWADLSGAKLQKANLRQADLAGARLGGIYLQGGYDEDDITDAMVRRGDFGGADLREADLREATLYGVDFTEAKLTGADMTDARVGLTLFVNVDLRSVMGLETVSHITRSVVSIDTIYRSQGDLPERFLRGVGVPNTFITYARSLVGQPIDYYSCFISHSSHDQPFVERLHADLQNKGVRCWFAPEDLKIGDKIRPRIDESIRVYDKLLLVLSQHSVASQWVEQEVETALAKERKENRTVLFPIRLDKTVMEIEYGWPALIRNTRHIGDFSRWKRHDTYQKAFDRLLSDLKTETTQEGGK